MIYVLRKEDDVFSVPYVSEISLKYISDNNYEYIGYAITDNKKYIKEFKQTRNMDRFIIREHIFSDDDSDRFLELYSQLVLAKRGIQYDIEARLVDILLTEHEFHMIDSFEIESEIGSDLTLLPYNILLYPYIDALDAIIYNTFHDIYYNDDSIESDVVSDAFYGGKVTVGGRNLIVNYNHISVMVEVYGDIINIDGIVSNL